MRPWYRYHCVFFVFVHAYISSAYGGLKQFARKGLNRYRESPSLAKDNDTVKLSNHPSRRRLLFSAVPLSSLLISVTTGVKSACARDELFRPNPLTNPILEQVLQIMH